MMDNLVELANKICDGLKIAAYYSADRPYTKTLLNEASAFIEGILPMLTAEESNKNKKDLQMSAAELHLTFGEQLMLKAAEAQSKIKEARELTHKAWLENHSCLIEYLKAELIQCAESTCQSTARIDICKLNLTNNDVEEIKYYFEKEGIEVDGEGFALVKTDVFDLKTTMYSVLKFTWQ